MTIKEKVKWLVLPSLLVIGFGALEIKFPRAMDGFHDGYTGRGMAGFIVLLFELSLMLTWGKVEGIILILLGLFFLLLCCLPQDQQSREQAPETIENEKNDQGESITSFSSSAFQLGRAYLGRRSENQQS